MTGTIVKPLDSWDLNPRAHVATMTFNTKHLPPST